MTGFGKKIKKKRKRKWRKTKVKKFWRKLLRNKTISTKKRWNVNVKKNLRKSKKNWPNAKMYPKKKTESKSKKSKKMAVRKMILNKSQTMNTPINNSLSQNKKIMRLILILMGKPSKKVLMVHKHCRRKKSEDLKKRQKKLLWLIRVHYLLRKRRIPMNQMMEKGVRSKNNKLKGIQVYDVPFVNLTSIVETSSWNTWRKVDTPQHPSTWNEVIFT